MRPLTLPMNVLFVIWNGWQNIGSSVGNSMLSGKIKAKYADDAVYMSMKLPSDSVHPTLTERVNGSILNYQPDGYSNLINIRVLQINRYKLSAESKTGNTNTYTHTIFLLYISVFYKFCLGIYFKLN